MAEADELIADQSLERLRRTILFAGAHPGLLLFMQHDNGAGTPANRRIAISRLTAWATRFTFTA
ncbi:hypothetical protein [Novosphingobium sp. 9]|uniref:hypothetical protein n=1 Tax=Novosphingobium sp. 9 TaxID=2025349 RepID=UPI0021B6C112|nr:hypothetical protein [Novosphingobium sp. 9]